MEVGDSYTFRPSCMLPSVCLPGKGEEKLVVNVPQVTGTVIYINEAHRWFRVRYVTPAGITYHECFPIRQEPEPMPEEAPAPHRAWRRDTGDWWAKPSKFRNQPPIK